LNYRIQKGATADASEENFVNDGLAMLEVTFAGPLHQGIERTKKIGFEVREVSGKYKLIGSMPLERINELRSLPDILLVAPYSR